MLCGRATEPIAFGRACGKIPGLVERSPDLMPVNLVNRTWRGFATCLSFVAFGAGLTVMALVVTPYIRLTSKQGPGRRARGRRAIKRAMRLFLFFMRVTGVLRPRVEGCANIPSRGAYVVAAQHPTLIDAPLLLCAFPDLICVAKQSLAQSWFFGPIIRTAGYLDNGRPMAIVEEGIAALRAGNKLLIFPHGTRAGDHQPRRAKRGAAGMAVRAGCPVIPVTLDCDPPTLSYANPWYRIPARIVNLSCQIHPPMLADDALHRRDATADLHSRLEDVFQAADAEREASTNGAAPSAAAHWPAAIRQ